MSKNQNSVVPKPSHDTAAETQPINSRVSSGGMEKSSNYTWIPRGDVFRIFEAVEDGQVTEFKEYLHKYSKNRRIRKKFLKLRNINQRTLLHIACQRGSIDILEIILHELREHKVNALTFDVNGDSPLDLACIRGFDVNETEKHKDENYYPDAEIGFKSKYTSKRYQVVKRLLEYKDHNGKIVFDITKGTCRKRMNTPLHWAIYWTDLELAELVFCEFPAQIFFPNKDDMIPFDMCYQTQSKFLEKKSMIIVYYLLDDIFDWLNKHGKTEDFGPTHMSTENKKVVKRDEIRKNFERLKSAANCMQMINNILDNDTADDYVELRRLYSESKLSILDHSPGVNFKKYNKMDRYVQRLALWYGFFKKFHISPFAISSFGRATIHMLCLENRHQFLELILLP